MDQINLVELWKIHLVVLYVPVMFPVTVVMLLLAPTEYGKMPSQILIFAGKGHYL